MEIACGFTCVITSLDFLFIDRSFSVVLTSTTYLQYVSPHRKVRLDPPLHIETNPQIAKAS